MPKNFIVLATLSIIAGGLLTATMVQAEGELPSFSQGETEVFQNKFGEGVIAKLTDPTLLAVEFDIPAREGFKAVEGSAWIAKRGSTLTVEEMTTLSQRVGIESWNESWKIESMRGRTNSYSDLNTRDLQTTIAGSSPFYMVVAPYHTIFYAAEYRDINDLYGPGYFVRGSIDYRSCARAKSFVKNETNTCETIMAEDQTFALVPSGTILKNESYGTWKDIVAEMAEEWMDSAIAKIELIEQKKSIAGLTEDDKTKVTEALKDMKEEAERFGVEFATYFGDYELRVAALLTDNEQDVTNGNTSYSGHGSGSSIITTEAGINDASKEVTQEEVKEAATTESPKSMAASDVNEQTNTDNVEGEIKEGTEEKENISTEDVEVPKLGGETKKNWGWLLLLPVIGALVWVILWSKRQRTEEER